MTTATFTQYLLVLILISVSVGIISLTFLWFYRRSEMVLSQWAEKNDYEILDQKLQWLNQGPFFWRSSSGQTIYRVRILNRQDGKIYIGWVRCGSYWGGLFSDQVDVMWDKE